MATTLQYCAIILETVSPYIVPTILAIWAFKRIDFTFKFTRSVKSKTVEKSNSIEIRAKYNE